MMIRLVYFSLFMLTAAAILQNHAVARRHIEQDPPLFELEVNPKAISIFASPHLVNASGFSVKLYHPKSNISCATIHDNSYEKYRVKKSKRKKSHFTECHHTQCSLQWDDFNISGCYCALAEIDGEFLPYLYYHTKTLCVSSPVILVPIENGSAGLRWWWWLVLISVCVSGALIIVLTIAWKCKRIKLEGFLAWRRDNEVVSRGALEKGVGVGVVFVVYYNDNSEHLQAVKEFSAQLVKHLNCEVILDCECIESICTQGIDTWVCGAIARSSAIILINSKGACERVRAHRVVNGDVGNHFSEIVFLLTWRYITTNYSLQNNYRKVFSVKFETTDDVYLLREVVPGRHFNLPNDFQPLVRALACEGDYRISKCSESSNDSRITESAIFENVSLLTAGSCKQ